MGQVQVSHRGRDGAYIAHQKACITRPSSGRSRCESPFHEHWATRHPNTSGMLDAYRHFDEAVLAYAPSDGFLAYREKLAAYYNDLPAHPLSQQTTLSSRLAAPRRFYSALAAVTDPGDRVLVCEPYYTNYAGFVHMLSLGLDAVSTRPEESHAISPERVEAAITPKTRALIIPSPGNPTGVVLSEDELDALIDICRRHGIFFICDEVYREFVYDQPTGTRAPSVLSRVDTDNHRRRLCVQTIFRLWRSGQVPCDAQSRRAGCCALEIWAARLFARNSRPVRCDGGVGYARHLFPRGGQKSINQDVIHLYRGLAAFGIQVEKPKGRFISPWLCLWRMQRRLANGWSQSLHSTERPSVSRHLKASTRPRAGRSK